LYRDPKENERLWARNSVNVWNFDPSRCREHFVLEGIHI